MIPKLQDLRAPIEPSFFMPLQTINSLFSGRVAQKETVKKTKDVIENLVKNHKTTLKEANLSGADLSNITLKFKIDEHTSLVDIYLRGTSFDGSKITRFDFSDVKMDGKTSFVGTTPKAARLVKLGEILH